MGKSFWGHADNTDEKYFFKGKMHNSINKWVSEPCTHGSVCPGSLSQVVICHWHWLLRESPDLGSCAPWPQVPCLETTSPLLPDWLLCQVLEKTVFWEPSEFSGPGGYLLSKERVSIDICLLTSFFNLWEIPSVLTYGCRGRKTWGCGHLKGS